MSGYTPAWPLPTGGITTYPLPTVPGVSVGATNNLLQLNANKNAWLDVKADGYAVCDGITDDTDGLNAALEDHKYVTVPPGVVCQASALTAGLEGQRLWLQGDAAIRSVGDEADLLVLGGNFAELWGGYVVGVGETQAAIRTEGFRNVLNSVTSTGDAVQSLLVSGLETQVMLGKYRGGATSVIHIEQPDCSLWGPYVEQGLLDGVTATTGSIMMSGVHSFGNARHGFRLVGSSFSQLWGCYADTNGQRGFDIADSAAGLTLTDCWGFRSSSVDSGHSDFNFSNAHNVKVWGSRSSGVIVGKLASFRFLNSDVEMVGCVGDLVPVGDLHMVGFTGCSGALGYYNRATDVAQTASIDITTASTVTARPTFRIPSPMTSPGVMSFDVAVTWRNSANTAGGVDRFEIRIPDGVSGVAGIVDMTDGGAQAVSISDETWVELTPFVSSQLELDLTNIFGSRILCSVNARLLGTTTGWF